MELDGLLCSTDFAGEGCELDVYEFEKYKIDGDKYSGTARFELTIISYSSVDDLKEEYRKGSTKLIFMRY